MPNRPSVRTSVLLVSAKADRFRATQAILQRMNCDYPLEWARTPLDALYWIHGRMLHLVLIDVSLPAGAEVLVTQIARTHPQLPVLTIGDQADGTPFGTLSVRSDWNGLDNTLQRYL